MKVVPQAGLEPACLSAVDFESTASTNSATGASGAHPTGLSVPVKQKAITGLDFMDIPA